MNHGLKHGLNSRQQLFQVICKKDGVIKLYCKGADTTVYEYLDAKCSDLQELTTSHLNVSYFWQLTKIT